MGATPSAPKLAALRMLLATAQELSRELASDPVAGRVLRALTGLQPDEREVLTTAIERGVAWRRVNESIAGATGVRLRVNPKPVLFLRVVDGPELAGTALPDQEDIMLGVLRLMRLARMLRRPEAQALWRPAVAEAIDLIDPAERADCIGLVHEVLAALTPAGADDEPTPTP